MYENLQQLLLLAAQGKNYDDVLAKVLDFYGEDFDEDKSSDENLQKYVSRSKRHRIW